MSTLHGNGYLITYMETEVTCPICDFTFDASEKIDKAKHPAFKTKCPRCKGKIGISTPIMGGKIKCYELPELNKSNSNLKINITPNKVNGKPVVKKLYDDNSDDMEDIEA